MAFAFVQFIPGLLLIAQRLSVYFAVHVAVHPCHAQLALIFWQYAFGFGGCRIKSKDLAGCIAQAKIDPA
ncbi:hypothetical protein D3C86_1802140 [compost metagenome]